MRDVRPYATYNDTSVFLAIAQGRPPADLAHLSLPYSVTQALLLCWGQAADLRPTATACMGILSHAAAGRTVVMTLQSRPHSPPHNPLSSGVYDFESMPTFSAPDKMYVTLLQRLGPPDPPTLTIPCFRHDPLLGVSNSRRTANNLPLATLKLSPLMKSTLPKKIGTPLTINFAGKQPP